VLGLPPSVAALAAVGFNPQSQPLLGLSLVDLLGADAEDLPARVRSRVHGLYLLGSAGIGPACVSPPALTVPPTDPDALYDYRTRIEQNPAILARMQEVANTGTSSGR